MTHDLGLMTLDYIMSSITVKYLSSFTEKAIGLLGKSHAYPVMFKTRFGIHTFGLKFSIDVLILNKDFQIIKLTENLKPNNIFFWPIRYDNVIELPAGMIKEIGLKIGQKITIQATK